MFKKLTYAAVGLLACASIAYAGGAFQGYPLIGGDGVTATNCLSFGNNAVCNQFQPAGPSLIASGSTIPADTNIQGAGNAGNPATVDIPVTSLGAGNTIVNTTTGTQTIVVAAGVSNYVYAGAGAATFTTFTLPPTPTQNQSFCLVNSGTGIITLSSIVVAASPQLIVGTAPTSLPVMTAVGTAGTVTLGTNCWLYNVATTTWYRSL